MKLHFIKEQISRSVLELAVSEWKNKVIDTESDKKLCGMWTPHKEFCVWSGLRYKFI